MMLPTGLGFKVCDIGSSLSLFSQTCQLRRGFKLCQLKIHSANGAGPPSSKGAYLTLDQGFENNAACPCQKRSLHVKYKW